MTNLSQQKREAMLAYLSKLKDLHGDDESLYILNQIETELKEKSYGLIWEEHSEHVDQMLVDNIPVFVDVPAKAITAEPKQPYNFLLEGDNLHSLLLLQRTHKNKIQVIYIDPPYNTQNEGFVYNDKIIAKNDGFIHSKWLSFMQRRLKLAYSLLSDDGVVFISIDDNEMAQLKLLCDNLFGEHNFVANIPRLTSPQRFAQEKNINISHDYVLVYKKSNLLNLGKIKTLEAKSNKNKPLQKDHIGHYYEGDTKAILAPKSQGYSANCDYDVEFNGKIFNPVDSKGVRNRWFWTKERMEKAIELGIVRETAATIRMQIYQDKVFDVATNTMQDKELGLRFTTRDLFTNAYSNVQGSNDFAGLNLEARFNNPKPLKLIQTLVSLFPDKNCTVLDFFAGSGTTGHAVQQLNKEDGGNRTYILCTNNENNICQEVTYQRLAKIQEELPHNLRYYRTDFVPKYNAADEDFIVTEATLEYIRS